MTCVFFVEDLALSYDLKVAAASTSETSVSREALFEGSKVLEQLARHDIFRRLVEW